MIPKEINLKNLNESTKQEVFDWVVYNLLKQNKQSINEYKSCLYRHPNGLKCAAGWLIEDSKYKSSMEGRSWTGLINDKLVPINHYKFISDLQFIHDSYLSKYWKEEFTKLTIKHNLSTKIIKQFN